jgi:hypothetical protein
MPFLPNANQADLDLRKLSDYCLNPLHPRGRHKARVFRAAGISRGDAAWLKQALLEGVCENDAIQTDVDAIGERWRADIAVTRHFKSHVIRTIWIVRRSESFPRFVTCWML